MSISEALERGRRVEEITLVAGEIRRQKIHAIRHRGEPELRRNLAQQTPVRRRQRLDGLGFGPREDLRLRRERPQVVERRRPRRGAGGVEQ